MTLACQSGVLLFGRLLLALLFLLSAVRGIMHYPVTVDYFARLGVPAPAAMVWMVVLVELFGGALLAAGWQTRRAAWLLAAFVGAATFIGHRFWEFEGAQHVNQLNHFLKNLALIGGLLYVAVLGAGKLSVDGAR